MKNAPIIDLSLRAPHEMIAERGTLVGPVLIAWFRLVRPALVGGVWASICIYTYRYLLPFNEAEMPIEQIVFYVTSIALIAGTIVTWLIAGASCIRSRTGCAYRRCCGARPARRRARCPRTRWPAHAATARGARRAFWSRPTTRTARSPASNGSRTRGRSPASRSACASVRARRIVRFAPRAGRQLPVL